MSIETTFFVSFCAILLGLMGVFAVGFLPLEWSAEHTSIKVTQSFARFFFFSALMGGLVVGLYKAAVVMVKHL